MLSQEMIDIIQDLATHEIINSLTYMQLSHELSLAGLTNLAKYYEEWSLEERIHNSWCREFAEQFNFKISINNIPSINLDIEDITHFYEVSQKAELETNKLWQNALDKAYNEEDYGILTNWIKGVFLKEQREETGKMQDLIDKCKPFTGNLALLHLFDQNFIG